MPIEASDVSLEELDYHLEPSIRIRVDERGSANEFECVVRQFAETDAASGDTHAKIYECEVTRVLGGDTEYDFGDSVRVDNRDITRVYDS